MTMFLDKKETEQLAKEVMPNSDQIDPYFRDIHILQGLIRQFDLDLTKICKTRDGLKYEAMGYDLKAINQLYEKC